MVQQRTDLEEFFNPTAVALVGSVNRSAKPERLRAHYGERWGDRWYLVNAKGGSVGDIPIYEHVTDIPASVELAVVNVGTRYVLKTVRGVRRARRQVRAHLHCWVLRSRSGGRRDRARRSARWRASTRCASSDRTPTRTRSRFCPSPPTEEVGGSGS